MVLIKYISSMQLLLSVMTEAINGHQFFSDVKKDANVDFEM